jgi:hypothetical protein
MDAPEFDTEYRNRDGAIPRFYMDTRKNNFRSEKEGRACFDDVEMVEILIPGDRKTQFCGLVNDQHRRRFAQQYAAFKAGLEAPVEGTPIAELPGLTRAQAEELAFAHVKTIEILANLSDDQLSKAVGMGGFKLREKAQRRLEQISGDAPMEKLAAENEAQAATIAEMQRQMAEMQKQMQAMNAAQSEA